MRLHPRVVAYLQRRTWQEVRRDQLAVMLGAHAWNVSAVARALGCARRTVYLTAARYGLRRPRRLSASSQELVARLLRGRR